MADREGFEPSIRLPVYTRSRRAPSTTRPPVRPGTASVKPKGGTGAIYTDAVAMINPNLTDF